MVVRASLSRELKTLRDLKNRRVCVIGLGKFGGNTAACRYLVRQGARVVATDKKPLDALTDDARRLADVGVTLKCGGGGHDPDDVLSASLVVASPAVRPDDPLLTAARDAGVRVATEIGLVLARLPTPLVFGVTGTKGKSTTASLLARMLGAWRPLEPERAAKVRSDRSPHVKLADDAPRSVFLGGNLGGSLLDVIDDITERDFVVLELSSFMLAHLAPYAWSPHVAVVTSLGLDHLDYHGSADAYHDAKRNIVRFQGEGDLAVVPAASPVARAFRDHTAARVVEFGKRGHLPEAFAPDLLGRHNRLNERAAYAAAAYVGVYPDQAAEACRDFAGLAHRLERVHVDARGVTWVDDSIATIPEAAAAACEAFDSGRVVQIVGGSDKGLDPTPMLDVFKNRCRRVLLIGTTGPGLLDALGCVAEVAGDLTAAVRRAREVSRPGDTVLLSPGFASYDQFADFEQRGDAFAALARETL